MKIGLTQRQMWSATRLEQGSGYASEWNGWIEHFSPGSTPIPIPNVRERIVEWLEALCPDLVILTGGEDFGSDPDRDDTEMQLLSHCAGKVPVLGVCRGAQVLNTWAGGVCTPTTDGVHAGGSHEISVTSLVPSSEQILHMAQRVNTFHNIKIPRLGLAGDFQPLAAHADGSVEAFGDSSRRLLGVMWHPERAEEGTWDSTAWIRSTLRTVTDV